MSPRPSLGNISEDRESYDDFQSLSQRNSFRELFSGGSGGLGGSSGPVSASAGQRLVLPGQMQDRIHRVVEAKRRRSSLKARDLETARADHNKQRGLSAFEQFQMEQNQSIAGGPTSGPGATDSQASSVWNSNTGISGNRRSVKTVVTLPFVSTYTHTNLPHTHSERFLLYSFAT